jgi:hypothetical protein
MVVARRFIRQTVNVPSKTGMRRTAGPVSQTSRSQFILKCWGTGVGEVVTVKEGCERVGVGVGEGEEEVAADAMAVSARWRVGVPASTFWSKETE